MNKDKILSMIAFFLLCIIIDTLLIGYINKVKEQHLNFLSSSSEKEAITLFDNITISRAWNSNFDGVYVKQTGDLKANPYLPNNHIYSKDNELLIKINHAWMTRQLSELSKLTNKHSFKLTSLNPINPDNKPSAFEEKALNYFEKNPNKLYYTQREKDYSNLNFMGVLTSDNTCMQCHATQNYQEGDVVGGISITLPLEEYQIQYRDILNNHQRMIFIIVFISILLFIAILIVIHLFFKTHSQLKENVNQLQQLTQDNDTLIIRYKYAIEGSQSGIWDWDLVKDEIYFDENWKKMLGYEPDELKNDFKEWDLRVHPDDKDKAIQDILDNQQHKTDFYLNVHRLRHKDGHWVWILDRGKTYFNDQNQATRMVGFHTDITQFKELEIELYEKEQNLMNAQRIARMGHWRYNATNDSFFISRALYTILGIKDAVNINSYIDLSAFVHSDDLNEFLKQHHEAINNRKKTSLQYKIVNPITKKIHYIEEHISFFHDTRINEENFMGTMQDITAIKRIEKELELFKQIIDDSPISILITDAKADIIYVNKYFSKVSGYTEDEIVGKNPRVLSSGETSLQEYKQMWETLKSKQNWSGVFKNLTKNKEAYWEAALIISIINENNQITNYLGIKREITKEIFLEKELKEKEDLMLIQSKNAAMGEMISMIAHQWRQPITIISMIANNILADVELEIFDGKNAKNAAIELSKQTQYLSQTIEDFRNFFKQDKLPEETNFNEIFSDISSIISASLKNNNIEFSTNYDESIRCKTYKRDIEQILINLIKNSKEAFIDNTQSKTQYIKIEVVELEDTISIKVYDNAGGIQKDNLEKIFNPYFTTKEAQNGTGLGLYMSKTIAQKHLKGDLSAMNFEQGVMFELTLQKFL